jgi:hypothetical protein
MHVARMVLACAAASALCLAAVPASATTIPNDLQYTYNLNAPLIGKVQAGSSGTCTQSEGDEFALTMTAGADNDLTAAISRPNNDIYCTVTLTRNFSGTTLSGTVTASGGGQSGSGTFNLVCEASQTIASWFNVVISGQGLPALADDPYGVGGTGYVSCNWTININDSARSQLSGTLEMNGEFSDESEQVNCEVAGITVQGNQTYCVSFDMNISAFLTGATGAYAGRTGTGSMAQRVYAPVTVPINITTDGGGGEGGGGEPINLTGCDYSPNQPQDPTGWQNFPAQPLNVVGWQGVGYYRCGGGGGGGGISGPNFTGCEYRALNDPPADPVGWYTLPAMPDGAVGWQGAGHYLCSTNPFTGQSVQVMITPGMMRSLFSAAMTSSSFGRLLQISTKRNQTGTVRFASPAATSRTGARPFGQPQGVTKAPTVRLSTVPGATCSVTAAAGKKSAAVATRKVATGGRLDTGMTGATLRTRLGVAAGSTASLTARCTVGSGKSQKALPAATITVRFG